MEFEELVVEFDEILENHSTKEYYVNKTGGEGGEMTVDYPASAFASYAIISYVIQLLGSWLAMCIGLREK